MGLRTLTVTAVLAAGGLTFGSGCTMLDRDSVLPKKPDVTKPGVLPPPQDVMKASDGLQTGGVVPAGGTVPAAPITIDQPAAKSDFTHSLSKLASRFERKVQANELALGWRKRIAYLPDPVRSGALGPGLVGQLFLFGGKNMQFVEADGTLTVDLIDETPRPAGQTPATPERWQFNKEMLNKLRTTDETFGQSYVLFLPWPAYKPDITKVRISARYDPENGHTLFATPTTLTIDTSAPFSTAPVWSDVPNPTNQPTHTGQQPSQLPIQLSTPTQPQQRKEVPKFDPIPLPAPGARFSPQPGTLSAAPATQPLPPAMPVMPIGAEAIPQVPTAQPTLPAIPQVPDTALPLGPVAPGDLPPGGGWR